jgi:DNA modification methylase
MIRQLTGDCRDVLKTLPEGSVNCCVTSPPYFGLRDYGHGGQIGLESTPDAYVAELVAVFRDVRRVLADNGTLWLNLGDSYAGGGNYRGANSEETLSAKQRSNGGARGVSQLLVAKNTPGLKPKDLIGIPWRVAFALQADGWWLRQDIIWSKPSPMPESVTDRCTKAHEYLFLLSKSARYHFDHKAIAEAATPGEHTTTAKSFGTQAAGDAVKPTGNQIPGATFSWGETRNKRSVWTIASSPFSEAHFATFPPALVEPCILAGCPVGGTVLDPFGGAGTTGLVADRLGRNAVLIELNPSYAGMAKTRMIDDLPLFVEVTA